MEQSAEWSWPLTWALLSSKTLEDRGTMAKVPTCTLIRDLSYYVTFQLYELISKPRLRYCHHLETCPVS